MDTMELEHQKRCQELREYMQVARLAKTIDAEAEARKRVVSASAKETRAKRQKAPKRSSKGNDSPDGSDSQASEGLASDVSGQSLEEVQADHQAAEDAQEASAQRGLPTYAQDTGRVHGPDGKYWGRVSVIKPGTKQEAKRKRTLAVVCRAT